jgi:hypothetical protein
MTLPAGTGPKHRLSKGRGRVGDEKYLIGFQVDAAVPDRQIEAQQVTQ